MAKVETKPGVDETSTSFRYRVRTPGSFQEGSFRTVAFKKSSPKIDSVMGRLKGETVLTLQSLIFPKSEGWEKDKVNAWVKEHRSDLKAIESEEGFEAEADWVAAPTVEDANLAALMQEQAALPRHKAGDSFIHKGYRGEVKGVREDSFEADVVISSGDIDRDREVVEPEGMTIAKPKRVPLVAGHFYGDLRKHIGDTGKPKHVESQIHARPKWFVGMGNAEADWGWTLAKLNVAAFSIGFIPLEWTDADLTDEKVLAQVKDGKEPLRRYTKWELVEVSQVVVPSNRNAVQRMITEGILSADQGEAILEKAVDGEMSAEAQKLFDKALAAYKTIKTEEKKPEAETKPRDEHGCEPGYDWNADTGKCEKKTVAEENILEVFSDSQPAPAAPAPKTPQEEVIDLPASEVRSGDLSTLFDVEQALYESANEILAELKRVEGVLLAHKPEISVKIDVEELSAALKATFEKAFQPLLPEDSAAFVSVKDLIPEMVNAVLVVVRREIEKAQGNVDHYRRGK